MAGFPSFAPLLGSVGAWIAELLAQPEVERALDGERIRGGEPVSVWLEVPLAHRQRVG